MLNFQYFTPTKVVFGKDAELKVGPLVKEEGCKKVLVHYGGQSAKKSGLLDRVCEALKDFDIDYVTLGGVVPNPHLSKVYEGIELCKKEGVDFILAVWRRKVLSIPVKRLRMDLEIQRLMYGICLQERQDQKHVIH